MLPSAAMRPRSLTLALLLVACTGKPSQPAPQDSPQPEAPAAAQPAAPAQPEPVPEVSKQPASDVAWWCTCYARIGPVAMTACRKSQDECKALEQKAAKGEAGIVAGSLTHVCREARGEHPGDALGGRDKWQPSKKPGAWISAGACLLSGPPDAPPPVAGDDEGAGPDVLKDESFGGLKLGIADVEVVELLGEPAKKDRPELWGADGAYHGTWHYPDLGLKLDLAGDKRKGPTRLTSITAAAPCSFRTSRGVGVGDAKSAVEAAYGKDREPGSDPDDAVFIAGSVYWGVFFTFDEKTKNVSEIFFGAGAE